jgi:uncharacterized protein (DUF2141 family)
LEVEVVSLRNSNGMVSMELLNEHNEPVKGINESIRDKTCIVTFDSLKVGKYAIRYYHDENSNNVLEKNILGIPKEGVGFSNNAYGRFGPKPFNHWLFKVEGDTLIKLITAYY